jgi:shikimate kinase
MHLIYIYGPPATGKLTVANELANLIDLKVFHNHLTVDLIKPFFEFGSKSFFELSTSLRLKIFESASKENIPGLIFTSCYSYPEDNRMVKKIINRVEKYSGKIFFVHLYANIDELKKRVKEPSRKNYSKVKTEDGLQNALEKWDMFTPIPFVESLQIDNTNLTPKEVAMRIKNYYKL